MSRPRGPSPRPTMRKVAAAAGVSTSTASRVLAGTAGQFPIAEATVQAVLEAAKRIGFAVHRREPERHAAGLVALISGLSFTHSLNIYAHVQDGLWQHARRYGHQLALIGLSDAEVWEVEGWAERVVGAVLLDGVGGRIDDLLPRLGIPAIAFNWPDNLPCDQVSPDDAVGAAAAADHLLAIGHRRIAYLRPVSVIHTRSLTMRLQTVQHCVAQAGGTLSEWVMPLEGRYGRAYDPGFAERWQALEPSERPTAIITYSDAFVPEIYDLLAQVGLRVPDDLSVVCGSDTPALRLVRPLPTAVQLPILDLCGAAVDLLMARRDGSAPAGPIRRVLAERLEIRNSTAPLRS